MVKRLAFIVLFLLVLPLYVNGGSIHAGGNGNNGSVTSIDVSGGTTGLTFGGGPITVSGTITESGTLGIANGGTNLTAATDDNVMVGNGTTWQSKAIGDCQDSSGNHLNYTASSNTFSCGTSDLHVGTVTSVATGFGLTGGAITATGTVSHVAPASDDQVYVSDSSSAATWRSLPDCTDTGGNHLNYTAATNLFSCGTTEATPTVLGKVATYNAIATVSNGIPSEVATADLTTPQTAAIAATTIYAVPSSGVGMYRVSYVAKLTTVGSVSSILGGATGFQVKYTDATDSVVVTTAAGPVSTLNTTQAQVSGVIIVYAKASTNIQYLMGYTSVVDTEMAYILHIKVEAM